MPAKSTKKESTSNQKFVVARSNDGTIQITFKIPYKKIKLAQEKAVKELGDNIQVPGFRKGKAPAEKVISQIPQNTLIEKTLAQILPKLISEAINQHKIRPAIYPKLELVKATEGEDWQVRATTCELPKITLGDYKKTIMGSARAKTIWTPDSAKASPGKPDKELSREEKEQEVIKLLLKSIKIKIPKLLIEEEVASRLSNLLARLEKLGLNLESYLASIGKTPETLRQEYEKQAKEAISLELILNKVIEAENIKIEESQVDAAIKVSGADPDLAKKLDTPEQRRVIRSVLLRRAALESLASLL
jgi:trigger factor